MKALVWPVETYGCESCTLRKNEEARLDAFEMKGLKKILWVSWTGFLTKLEGTVRHGQRREASIHHEETMKLSGERDNARNSGRRGRQRTVWVDNIKTWTGLSVEKSIRMTEDRDKWRKYVCGVVNPRIDDGLLGLTESNGSWVCDSAGWLPRTGILRLGL